MAKLSIAQMKQMVDEKELAHETLSRYGIQYRGGRGMDHQFCCPWHSGSGKSAHTDDAQDFTWCFLCEKDAPHGDRYSVVAGMYNLSRVEAIAKVAYDANLISSEEFESKLNGKVSIEEMNELRAIEEVRRKPERKVETDDFRAFGSILYTEMRDFFGLTKEHRKKLKEERHLSDERIKQDYFSFPVYTQEYEKFIVKMELKYPKKKDDLRHYAGFWFDKTTGRNCMISASGIGILIRNARQEAVAVQIRRDNPGEESRYIWYSSNFALANTEINDGGASPYHLLDVMLPQTSEPSKLGWLTITEGRFKAEVLASRGHTVISVQGVGNYKGILDEIAALEQQTGIKYKQLFICYDADMFSNAKVLKHAVGLANELKKLEDVTVNIITWPKEYGKGIDDLYFNGYGSHTYIFTPEQIVDAFQIVATGLMREYGLPKIPPELAKQFGADMQVRMELALGIK